VAVSTRPYAAAVEKIVYLLWGDGDPASGDRLRGALVEDLSPTLAGCGALAIGVNVHDSDAAATPAPVPVPAGEDPHVAEVSVWIDSYDRRAGMDESLTELGLRWAGYLVVESLYEDYGTTPHASARQWPDGARSPGVLTVSLIHRPEGVDYAEWIERWHGTQSPLSGRLQPRCRYVRNEVVRPLTAGAPEIDGIVEEAWPSARHVADPMLFFSADHDPATLEHNLAEMLRSVEACLDLTRLRNVTMSEYLIKTLGRS
jgi:hypothetical protein